MSDLRNQTVNLCGADESLWQTELAGEEPASAEASASSGASLHRPGLRSGSPFTLGLAGPGRWKSVPRHVEPDRAYLLECDVKGSARIGLIWVREGKPLQGGEGQAGSLRYGGASARQVWRSPEGTPRFAQLTETGAVWSEALRTGDWQRVTVGGLSPCTANRAQVVLECTGEGETLFDHPYFDGLGAVPVEIALPAGFHPNSTKVAMVAVRERASRGRFELLSGGQVILAGHLIPWGSYIWGRQYWTADFSGVSRPGSYLLRVRFEDGREAISAEFEISPDLYLALPNLTLGWFHTQRCGVEVPGWHQACHLDDALIGQSRNRPLGPGGEWTITGEADLTGGWHDAGDNHKYICWSYLALWALARLQAIQRLARPVARGNELTGWEPVLRTDPLAEACWEARFLLKAVSKEGLFPFGVISRFGWVNVPVHEETDNVRNSGDERALPDPHERICEIPTYGPVFTSALVASSLAELALALRGDRLGAGATAEFAEACLTAAFTTWANHHQAEPPDAEYLRWHAAFALLDTSLYRHRPEQRLRQDLEDRISRIIAQQKPEGVFPFPKDSGDYQAQVLGVPREERAKLPDLSPQQSRYTISHEACGIDYIPAPFTYLHALADYLELFPEGPQAKEARGALGLSMDLALTLTQKTPFGQMMEWTFAPDPVNFVHMFHGYNCALLSLAVVACRAGALLRRPELVELAERQMQWVLGRNPRGTSLVCGVGQKQLGIYHTGLSFQDEHRTGEQPGGVVNGFVSMGAPRLTYSGPPYPWDFPYLDIRSPAEEAEWRGIDADWWTNETWVPNCSWLIMAAVALHRALESQP